MKLRTQILLFSFLFALTPLLLAVLINLPLVLERMERFYHEAHLQNLQADFRDLDQHLASRNEMVRLLTKLPAPGIMLGSESPTEDAIVDLARAQYIHWIGQILASQLDIVQIVFFDATGQERFWLDRDTADQAWQPTMQRPTRPPEEFIATGLQGEPGQVLVSSISLDPEAGAVDPRKFMTLRLISPIHQGGEGGPVGAAMISIDVGGMARYYRNTLWVRDNGNFLTHLDPDSPDSNAFDRFPGLEKLFTGAKATLWEGNGQQIMWVPMFITEQAGALWVGRQVDPSPIAEFRNVVTLRVLSIVFILIVATWAASQWLARRASRVSHELTDGIQHILEHEEAVAFNWTSSEELKTLGESLSRLAAEHGRNTRNLRAHARELEESNRYKSQFLANVSHELRTPLNSILLLSKLLSGKNSGLGLEQQKQAKVINEAGTDLQTLIDNILDLSRIEARRTEFNLESIELSVMLKGLIELMQPQFDAKGIELRLEILPDAPQRVISDPDKVRQILKNFLSNSVKFADGGDVWIRLAAEGKSDLCDCELRISVEDDGIGIAKDKHDQIFEAFKQAEGSTNRRYGGTGLGLSISRQLAHLLGGKITLESQEGVGSTFSLLLPLEFERGQLTERAEVHREQDKLPVVSSEPPPANFGGQQVLVVDNSVQNLLMITPLLEGWGLRVTAAADSQETLEVLEEDGPFSLVLVDIIMPHSEGCDTISCIRGEVQHQRLPIIALIGEADAQSPCLTAGADNIIAKPIEPKLLKEALAQHLHEEDRD
ncbi:MAG: ATP-binding protein [Candidatus Sedimenticola sp. (ex Thyasira tokunagai)]